MQLSIIIEDLILIFGSSILAFIIAILLTPWFTELLVKYRIGKQLRQQSLSGEKAVIFTELHANKAGTPTMGGILIWGTITIVVIISIFLHKFGIFNQSLFNRKETWIPLFTLLTTGILGAVDDYINVRGIGKNKGLTAKLKFFWLLIFSGAGAWWFFSKLGYDSISVPGYEVLELGLWYIPLFMLVVIATANAVNFTDGLDGLASGPIIMAFGSFAILAYTQGLLILAAFCTVICGAVLAFLWFNVPPAKFYMGDTGALALGATLGVTAMLTDQVFTLPIIGFIFVIETLSIILQLSSKKFFKKKLFHIAPIHHHFEKIGWKEYTIVMRFWIIGGIMTAFGTILGLINIS